MLLDGLRVVGGAVRAGFAQWAHEMHMPRTMNITMSSEPGTNETKPSPQEPPSRGAGAEGDRSQPATQEGQHIKWPGGGPKGEDESEKKKPPQTPT